MALPKWRGASTVYSRLQKGLAEMARRGHATAAIKSRGKVRTSGHVSQEMRDIIEAMDEGNEEKLKGYVFWMRDYGYLKEKNPRGGRTMARRTTRKSNARAADRWGVYVKSQLAYVSTKKLDANKAASKLRLSGRANITQKKVGPNPVSGKVPVVGWRAEFKKAAYSAMKAPGVRRKRVRTTSKIRQTRQRRGENPKKVIRFKEYGNVERGTGAPGYRWVTGYVQLTEDGRELFPPVTRREAQRLAKSMGGRASFTTKNPGPSSRAVAGRIGRAVGARVKSRNPRSAGVGTRSVMRGGTFRGSVGRKRNAPSILRRRNPSGTITRSHVGKSFASLPGARQSDASSFGKVLAIDVGKRYYVRDGIFQMENNEQRDKRLKRNPRTKSRTTTSNPSSGYVVQVGNTVAWVGKLAADAQKAMRKLMAGGRKGVKGFAAKLPVGIKRGWRSQFKAMSRKRNSTKRPTVAYGPPGTVVKTRAEWGSVANAKDYVRRHGGAAFVVNADGRSGVVYTLGVGGRIHERKVRANASFGKGKLGSGSRFKSCVRTMKRRGVASPSGLCASIGRRKYGAKRMAGMAKRGRARRSNPQQPSRRWEGYFLRAANEKTVYSLGDLRRDQAMRAAAGLARRKGADVTVYRGKTSLWPSGRTTYGTKKRIALIKVGS